MTPEDRPPRKRGRRRRRRGTGSAGPDSGNGNPQMSNADSIGNTVDPYRDRSGSGPGAQRRRRRRQRSRGGREAGSPLPPEAPIPVDIAPGELTPVSGVLYIKPNGGGLLVPTP